MSSTTKYDSNTAKPSQKSLFRNGGLPVEQTVLL